MLGRLGFALAEVAIVAEYRFAFFQSGKRCLLRFLASFSQFQFQRFPAGHQDGRFRRAEFVL